MISIDMENSGSESDDSWTPSKGPPGAGPASGRRYRWVYQSSAPSPSASSGDTVEPLPLWAQVAYEDGSIVEYYSRHHDQWFHWLRFTWSLLRGTVPLPLSTTSGLAGQNSSALTWTCASCEDTSTKRIRRGAHSQLGVWQTARISKAAQSNLGRAYRVSLDGAGDTSLVVPATSVRIQCGNM